MMITYHIIDEEHENFCPNLYLYNILKDNNKIIDSPISIKFTYLTGLGHNNDGKRCIRSHSDFQHCRAYKTQLISPNL